MSEDEVIEPINTFWDVIKSWIPPSEQDEVRRQIGEALLSEVEALHQELCLLTDIWKEYRKTIDIEVEDTAKCSQKELSMSALPEPPQMRERLEKEIRFFVQLLRSSNAESIKADVVQRICSSSAEETSPRSKSASIRPHTGRSHRGEEFPVRPHTASCTLHKTVELLEEQGVSLATIENQKEILQKAIRNEIDAMTLDIDFMRKCIDGEHEYRAQLMEQNQINTSNASMITLSDLRQARAALERDYHKYSSLSSDTIRTSNHPRAQQLPLLAAQSVRRSTPSQISQRLTTKQVTLPDHTSSKSNSEYRQAKSQLHLDSDVTNIKHRNQDRNLASLSSQIKPAHSKSAGTTFPDRQNHQPRPPPSMNAKREASGTATSPDARKPHFASAHLRAHRLIPSIQGSRRLPEVPQSRKPAQPS